MTRATIVPLVLTLGLLVACASSGTSRPGATIPDRREQLARAQDLAGQAQQAHASGDLDRAILLSRQAVAEARDHGQAWNNLGLYLFERGGEGDAFDAREAFALAADLLVSDPRPLSNLGIMYLRAGWAEKALAYFERALERAPNDLTSLRGAIDSSLRLRRHDERTLERLERVLGIESDPGYLREYQIRRAQIADELERQRRAEREAALRS